jgi:hypothetical protein
MSAMSASATLALWDAGDGLPGVERALALAAGAGGAAGRDEVARLPLGRRDARLLTLHRELGGAVLEATVACPACGEAAEFAVEAEALLARAPADGPGGAGALEADGFRVDWRALDSRDLLAAAAAPDAAAAEAVLLARCVVGADGPDGPVAAAALPRAVRDAVAAAMAEADPLAEVLVDVACPACETRFAADLDVGEFVWAEVRRRALALLRDVDALARAYGWTEPDVLALDDRRRRAYLDLIGQGAR